MAKVAAILAAKDTSRLIPYCHPLPIDHVSVDFELLERAITTTVTVKTLYKTGVEIEALTAASVAALTLYDMMKMFDEAMEIESVRLVKKSGGKGDFRDAFATPLRAAVLVMSDTVSSGRKQDTAGKAISERLVAEGLVMEDYRVVPDDLEKIVSALREYSEERQLDLVVTTGGTGLGPRDVTPEAMDRLIERELPGVAEAVRAFGREHTPRAMLSRGRAGTRGKTLIVNLPGSRKAVEEGLDALLPALLHAFKMMEGEGHP